MIKVLKYNEIMQNDVKNFIIENMSNELQFRDSESFGKITKDLDDIEKNYIDNGGEVLFAYDTQKKKIAGTIAIKFEKGVAVLKRFYVDENYRKMKIGFLLYSKLEEKIKYKKLDKIYLTTGKELKCARNFYKKNGWKIEENNPGIYVRNGADLFKKELEVVKMKEEKEILEQADLLLEAIPYINEFKGKIIVVKYGGNAMTDEVQKLNVIKQISFLKMLGMKVVLVHGGGTDIEEELKQKNIETKFENGLRVTDKDTVDLVKMVLIGKTNSELVKMLNMQTCNAVGLSGLDNSFVKCKKINDEIGFVGKIESIDKKLIMNLLESDCTPVISPIGTDDFGNSYNINADTFASEIAIVLNAKKIIFLTNTNGLLDKNKNLISLLESNKIDSLIEDGTITGGMIPKIMACKKCIENGVERTHILNGMEKNTIIYELLSDNGVGTMIV